jgi:hypothetical protein
MKVKEILLKKITLQKTTTAFGNKFTAWMVDLSSLSWATSHFSLSSSLKGFNFDSWKLWSTLHFKPRIEIFESMCEQKNKAIV